MASRSWNRVELIGNLTRDPELRFTPSGAAVCTFSVATNRTYVSSDGEKKEEADFHRCVSWNKLAELCNQLLKKGNRAFVSGRLQNRSWEAADGQTKYMTEIVIEDMIVLTPRSEYGTGATPDMENINLDDLPKAVPVKESATSADSSTEVMESKKASEDKEETKVTEGKTPEAVEESATSETPPGEGEDKKKDKKAPSEDVSPDEDLPF